MVDCCGDHARCLVALHAHVDDVEGEAVAALFEFFGEVVPRRAALAGDHADAQRHERQRALPVGVVRARCHESANDFVALDSHFAERVARIDTRHLQADSASGRIEIDRAEDPNLHAVAKLQPVCLQQWPKAGPVVGEQRHVEHGFGVVSVFDDAEVHVRATFGIALDLAANPYTVAETIFERGVDGVGEFANRERVFSVGGGLEVEGWLSHLPILPERGGHSWVSPRQ